MITDGLNPNTQTQNECVKCVMFWEETTFLYLCRFQTHSLLLSLHSRLHSSYIVIEHLQIFAG